MTPVSSAEIAKFDGFARSYWDPEGPMRMLHRMNPLRVDFTEAMCPLQDARVLDIGCGGGLAAEAMARRGAIVTGLDASPEMHRAAQRHATETGVAVDYQLATAEDWARDHAGRYDLVTAFEMIEHVPDPAGTVAAMSTLLAPGGVLVLSTLNRTPIAYAGAIVFAEYIAQWVPKGTHDYQRFLKPSELAAFAREARLDPVALEGLIWHPLYRQFQRSTTDLSVNYLFAARAGS